MKRIIGLAFILFIFFSHQAFSSGWDDYKPDTISKMITAYKKSNVNMDYLFTPGMPFKATVIYSGKKRKIIPERAIYVANWVKTHGMSPDMVKVFDQEILIEEEGVAHWLPVQNVLIPHLDKEVKPNDKVILFIVLAGSAKNDFIFFVNEFNTL